MLTLLLTMLHIILVLLNQPVSCLTEIRSESQRKPSVVDSTGFLQARCSAFRLPFSNVRMIKEGIREGLN